MTGTTDEHDGDPLVVRESTVDPDTYDHGQRTFRQRRLGHAAGGEALGTSLYELDPGKRTWPAHWHTANEEAVYVLDGRVRLWLGAGEARTEHLLEPGAYVALPTGAGHTHELEGAGGDGSEGGNGPAAAEDGTARFLVVSTMVEPDVTVLPESGTVHVVAGDPPGEYGNRTISATFDADSAVPYWEDESSDDIDREGAVTTDDGTEAGPAAERVVAADDRSWTGYDHGERRFRRKQLGAAAGGRDLGASLYEVPPGKKTWPRHYHTGNEEAMYVLSGEGTVWLGPDRRARDLVPGTYVALPTGEASAHEVRAADGDRTGADEGPLRFLVFSTMNDPDVTVYPDRRSVGLYAGSAPGGDADARTLSRYLDIEAEVDYWEE